MVFSVYSLHSTMGLASRPRAMAAVPAVPTSSVSAAARTATVRRAAARSGAARQPADAVGRLWKGSGNVAALQGGLSLCAEGCTSQRTLPLHIAAAARLRRGIVAHRLQAAGSLGPGSSRGWRPAPGGCCKWPAFLLRGDPCNVGLADSGQQLDALPGKVAAVPTRRPAPLAPALLLPAVLCLQRTAVWSYKHAACVIKMHCGLQKCSNLGALLNR